MNQKWSMLKLGWQEEWEFLWRSLRIDHFWWRLRIKWFSAWSNYGGKRGRGRGAQHSMRKNSNQNLSDMIHDLLKTPNKKHFSHNILLSYWLFCPPYPASSKSHLSPPSSCSTTYSPFCEYLESLAMTSYRDSYRLLKRARLSEFRGFAVKVILSEALVRSKRRFLSGQSGGSCQGDRMTYRSDLPSLKNLWTWTWSSAFNEELQSSEKCMIHDLLKTPNRSRGNSCSQPYETMIHEPCFDD